MAHAWREISAAIARHDVEVGPRHRTHRQPTAAKAAIMKHMAPAIKRHGLDRFLAAFALSLAMVTEGTPLMTWDAIIRRAEKHLSNTHR